MGATARGLPALEWLLWKTDGSGHAAAYAKLLAQQIEEESTALQEEYQELLETAWTESDAWDFYTECYGQAVGGMDKFRLKKMVPDTRGKDSSPWVRGISGTTAACWQEEAQGVQAFLLGGPRPGSLNNLLLARGHVAHSQNLVQRTHAMQSAVRVATPHNPASVRAAQKAVAQLALGVRALASDVLHIPLAFTDADGD